MKNKKKTSKIIRVFDYKMCFYDFIKWVAGLPVIIDLRIKRIYVKDGKEHKRSKGLFKGEFLIISNHISYIDPIILSNAFWERRLGFVATNELFEGRILGTFLKICGCIPINKENISMKTFKDIKERFDRGHIVVLFPEGQIEKGEEQLTQFKTGAVLIALNSKIPIIPVYIEHRTKRFKRQRVFIGEQIDLKNYCDDDMPNMETLKQISEVLRKKELELERISKKK